MASRKTYFGIGLPPDLLGQDPSGPEGGADKEDRSSPTVVDDEKVAEGLKQLRSWYAQPETPPADGRPPQAPAAAPVGDVGNAGNVGSLARPTAVGHATAPPAAAAVHQQRPFAPDPMRATMYGHDVHRFDIETPPGGNEPPASLPQPVPAPAPGPTTALVLAARPEEAPRVGTPAPESPSPAPWGAFPLAPQGEAERLPRPAGAGRSSHELPKPKSRVPLSSQIFFGLGLLALVGAIVIWLQNENSSDTPQASPAATAPTNLAPPPSVPLPSTPPPAPAAGERGSTSAPAPATGQSERPVVPAAARPRGVTPPEKPTAAPRPATNRRRSAKVEVAKPVGEPPTETPPATTPTPAGADKDAPRAETGVAAEHAHAKTEPATESNKTEPAIAPETKKTEPTTVPQAPPRKRTPGRPRIGSDSDATLPPSED